MKIPLYTTPELSFTITGAPMISLRKAEGSFPSEDAPFSILSCGLPSRGDRTFVSEYFNLISRKLLHAGTGRTYLVELGEGAGMFVGAEGEADKIPKAVRRVAPRQSRRFGNTTSDHRKHSLVCLSFFFFYPGALRPQVFLSATMRSFFNKPAWATKTDDSGTEFYRRSGQTYSDIVAANREAHRKQKLAAEFAESASSPAPEENRKSKRPRKSDEHEEKPETEEENPETTSSPKPDNESETEEQSRRSISTPGEEGILSGSPEPNHNDETQPTTIPSPVHVDSTESQSTDDSNIPSTHQKPDDGLQRTKQIIDLDSDDTSGDTPSKHLARGTNCPPAQPSPTPAPPPPPPVEDQRVHILITSEIPNTKPLIVQRKISQALKDARLAWCERQGFTEQETSTIQLFWNGVRVFDVSTCRRFDIKSDKKKFLDIEDDPDAEQTELKIHMEAVSTDPLMMNRRGPSSPDIGGASPAPPNPNDEPGNEPINEPMKLLLKSPGLSDFKIKARPKTLVSKVIAAFRDKQNIPVEKTVHLVFDGDILEPDSSLGENDIADLDMLEVLIK
jgi:hypothetical protein